MKKKFKKGLDISEDFYTQIVRPLLEQSFPNVKYSAALIGRGSEVLGFDTAISTDHDWRPRVFIFITDRDFKKIGKQIEKEIINNLPDKFEGYSTNPAGTKDQRLQFVHSIEGFFIEYIGINPSQKVRGKDWLIIPEQRLLSVTKGKVFHDGLNKLVSLRKSLSYYPDDIRYFLLATEWKKIAQEEAFVGRSGDVGDELGSRIITTRIVESLMRICFIMEKEYIPYSKWFGSSFSHLSVAKKITPIFNQILSAPNWKIRETNLGKAYKIVLGLHNKKKLTSKIDVKMKSYYDRPYKVIDADRIVESLSKKIKSRSVKSFPLIGSINQFISSTDILENMNRCQKFKDLY